MDVFESINNNTEKATDIGERYISKTLEYVKLIAFQQLAYVLSAFGKILLIGSVLFLGLIFLAVAGAIAIGEALGDVALGYLIVGGIFILIGLIVYLARKSIDAKVLQKVQSKLYKDESYEKV